MSTPADMLLLRERLRRMAASEQGPPSAGPATERAVTYRRAFSPVALFGTVAQGRVDHERLQNALSCTERDRPERGKFLEVTLEPDDLIALEAATRNFQNAADAITRTARLAQRIRGDNTVPRDASALEDYRNACLRLLWQTLLGNESSASLERERNEAAGRAIAALKAS